LDLKKSSCASLEERKVWQNIAKKGKEQNKER
jgi:hypothetical protein